MFYYTKKMYEVTRIVDCSTIYISRNRIQGNNLAKIGHTILYI